MVASEALVGAHARYAYDSTTSVIGCILPPPSRRDPWTAWEDARLAKRAAALAAGQEPGPRDFHGGNCSVPSKGFHAVGGFDSALARGEDFEFGFRLANHGSRFAYSQQALSTNLGSHPYAVWAKNAEAFGRSEIALREGYAPEALADEAASSFRQQNVLNRAAVEFCSGSAALRGPAIACLRIAGRTAHHLRAPALAIAAYSAVYNILYWHGLIDSLGSDRFWPAVRRTTLAEKSPGRRTPHSETRDIG